MRRFLITYKQDGIVANAVTTMSIGKWLIDSFKRYPKSPTIILFATELDISNNDFDELYSLL